MGYIGHSWSERAQDAKDSGLLTASELAKLLRCDTKAIFDNLEPDEWHHTSKHYNKTNFYGESLLIAVATGKDIDDYDDDELAEATGLLNKMRAESKTRKTATSIVYKNCEIHWLEWGGTRKHPKATDCYGKGSIEIFENKEFVYIILADGRKFKKGKTTNGFCAVGEGVNIHNCYGYSCALK